MSNAELLSLQAGMYKYTQELDLTSKVVEKATSGLKDTSRPRSRRQPLGERLFEGGPSQRGAALPRFARSPRVALRART